MEVSAWIMLLGFCISFVTDEHEGWVTFWVSVVLWAAF